MLKPRPDELTERVALVTGAGSGIGRATARLLQRGGAAVAVVDVAADKTEAVASELREDGGSAEGLVVDLADTVAVTELLPRVIERFGRLDILVNNAGVTGEGPLLELPKDTWDRALAINLTAPFLLTQAFGRHVEERGGGGKIVNVLTSSLFRAAFVSGPEYVASKGGLLGLTRASAAFLADLDVNVNAVAPGMTDTPRLHVEGMSDEERAQRMQAAVSQGPMANSFKRVSTADDVAEVIVFLCSPGSRQVTGQVVHTSAGAIV